MSLFKKAHANPKYVWNYCLTFLFILNYGKCCDHQRTSYAILHSIRLNWSPVNLCYGMLASRSKLIWSKMHLFQRVISWYWFCRSVVFYMVVEKKQWTVSGITSRSSTWFDIWTLSRLFWTNIFCCVHAVLFS